MPVIDELFETPRLPFKIVVPVLVTAEAPSAAKLPNSGGRIPAWELAPVRQSSAGQSKFEIFISYPSSTDAHGLSRWLSDVINASVPVTFDIANLLCIMVFGGCLSVRSGTKHRKMIGSQN
jgi:hypothetical protein